ncbi:hypothetical protein VNO78_09221 [Psophocarpus tetragonolobus]|uniref:Uncharacterized protein n=1 Tax=Psophocarpus tetragonolobus TaxID=3891 RepID=A0AAN9SW53_PSOTE
MRGGWSMASEAARLGGCAAAGRWRRRLRDWEDARRLLDGVGGCATGTADEALNSFLFFFSTFSLSALRALSSSSQRCTPVTPSMDD